MGIAANMSDDSDGVRCFDSVSGKPQHRHGTPQYLVDSDKNTYRNIQACTRRLLLIDIRVRDFDDFRVFHSAIVGSECRSGHDQAAGAFSEERPKIVFRQARADCGVEL